jgi:hypothetical protein
MISGQLAVAASLLAQVCKHITARNPHITLRTSISLQCAVSTLPQCDNCHQQHWCTAQALLLVVVCCCCCCVSVAAATIMLANSALHLLPLCCSCCSRLLLVVHHVLLHCVNVLYVCFAGWHLVNMAPPPPQCSFTSANQKCPQHV